MSYSAETPRWREGTNAIQKFAAPFARSYGRSDAVDCRRATSPPTSAANFAASPALNPSARKRTFGTVAALATPALPATGFTATAVDQGSFANTVAVAACPAWVAVIVASAGSTLAESAPVASTAIFPGSEDAHVVPARFVTSPTVSSSNRARTEKRSPSACRRIVSGAGVSQMSVIEAWTRTRIGIGPSVVAFGGFVVTVASITKLGSVGAAPTVTTPVAVSTVTSPFAGGAASEKKFGVNVILSTSAGGVFAKLTLGGDVSSLITSRS